MLKIKKPAFRITHMVKSERVNALRKQYDAFLEEDKKRKERNEYILGKLDNMRYNSTALQVRHKPIVYGDLLPVYSRAAYRPEPFEQRNVQPAQSLQTNHTNQQNLQLDIPRKYVADTSSLLKEITKKYILIPKLRPSLTDDIIGTIAPHSLPTIPLSAPQTNVINKEDWKSKYDILAQLKNNEKEEPITEYSEKRNGILPENQSSIMSKYDKNNINDAYNIYDSNLGVDPDPQNTISGYNLESYNTKESTTKYDHEVPEKDTTHRQANTESESRSPESSKTSDNKEQEPSTEHAPVRSASIHDEPEINVAYEHASTSQQSEHISPVIPDLNTSSIEEHAQYHPEENLVASESNAHNTLSAFNANENQINEVPPQQSYPVDYEQPALDDDKPYSENIENVYLDPNEYNSPQDLKSTELVDEYIKQEPAFTTQEEDQYPMEMINVQNFTPNADVKLEDGVNVNPYYMAGEEIVEPVYETNPAYDINNAEYENPEVGPGIQEVEAPVDNSGIEEFDAEQREMFQSQDTAEYAYDQQAGGDQSYATEGYPQTVDYAAYDNTAGLPEQEYPVEINEHEETSSRYDQHYEQQYADQYEQQQYDQTQEQEYAQPVEGYEQTQEQYQDYVYQQPDSETVQNVEQVLDNEQGYSSEQLEAKGDDARKDNVEQAA